MQLPPDLLPISQCNMSLRFECSRYWPAGLPAVAINGCVVAGFAQKLVFNHSVDPIEREAVAELIFSLYPQMSFVETARFYQVARPHDWVPLDLLLEKWGFRKNETWELTASQCLKLPVGFQNWLMEKNVGAQELQVLLAADGVRLEPLLHAILQAKFSRQQGVQALENGVELLLLGKTEEEILPYESENYELWLGRLKNLRYPRTFSQDEKSRGNLSQLPWPGQSQARWVRQGDRAGIELKIFVANPTELKKSVHSLQKIQELLDQTPGTLWPEH